MDQLPDDCLLNIFTRLSQKHRIRLRAVSRKWCELIDRSFQYDRYLDLSFLVVKDHESARHRQIHRDKARRWLPKFGCVKSLTFKGFNKYCKEDISMLVDNLPGRVLKELDELSFIEGEFESGSMLKLVENCLKLNSFSITGSRFKNADLERCIEAVGEKLHTFRLVGTNYFLDFCNNARWYMPNVTQLCLHDGSFREFPDFIFNSNLETIDLGFDEFPHYFLSATAEKFTKLKKFKFEWESIYGSFDCGFGRTPPVSYHHLLKLKHLTALDIGVMAAVFMPDLTNTTMREILEGLTNLTDLTLGWTFWDNNQLHGDILETEIILKHVVEVAPQMQNIHIVPNNCPPSAFKYLGKLQHLKRATLQIDHNEFTGHVETIVASLIACSRLIHLTLVSDDELGREFQIEGEAYENPDTIDASVSFEWSRIEKLVRKQRFICINVDDDKGSSDTSSVRSNFQASDEDANDEKSAN